MVRRGTSIMDGIDPDVLLEWLQTGIGDERDLQVGYGFHFSCLSILVRKSGISHSRHCRLPEILTILRKHVLFTIPDDGPGAAVHVAVDVRQY